MEREVYNKMYLYEDVHWWFVARRLILQKILDHFYSREKGRILEVGCGSGGNLHMLSSYGDVFAMELDDEAKNIANCRNICNVKKGSLPDNIPFDEGFDLICMLDVLEHIDNDYAALQSIEKKLNENGMLIITVPAYKFLWSAHDMVCHHKRRYSKKELTDIVNKVGLSIEYVTYFNTFLFLPISIVRFLNNFIRRGNRSDINLPPNTINGMLKKIFSSERKFLPYISFPFGVSLLLVAMKNNRSNTHLTFLHAS